ncbi:MAG TPA: hypothetical protein VMS95_05985 [Candidatus Krumholzibacteriaceae bacterium]|jgi:hypothetical protein|nr:hypothetical protein [Candidatus Krumholzibacteriaceae bacterium]
MLPNDNEELEGTTLKVYLYVVKEGKAIGPRDVMRGANLSSPSVAYRHLQKLESLGLLQKDTYGEYIVKEKVAIKGHLWIGRNLVPRLIFYSFFFMGILSAEITVVTIRVVVNEPFTMEFVFLTFITVVAMALFLVEGVMLLSRTKVS